MGMSTAFGTALLNHILENANIANIGDATGLQGSGTVGNLYISLHSADPTAGGNQSSNEVTYTGYARVACARTSGVWTVSGMTFQNAAAVTFPTSTGGSVTATYFALGTSASGAGMIVGSGALTASLAIANGTEPQFAAGVLTGSVS